MTSKGSVLVIGSGAAGSSAARALADKGWDVTIAEHGKVGGTCLWRGCIPKKALYTAARAVREARRAEQFGVMCAKVEVDWQGVLAWKWHAQETYAGDQRGSFAARGIRIIDGSARFISPDEVIVADETLRPDHIVLATGSVPVMPDVAGIDRADDSDGALRFLSVPAALAIVGGGFIALELAAIFSSFGSKVTVIERGSRILGMLDSELAEVARRRLESYGAEFITDATFSGIAGEPGTQGVRLRLSNGSTRVVEAERVVVAAGRQAQVEGLDLAAAGIEIDTKGRLVVDEHLRTSNERVWVCGDVAGGMMQTPVASMQGRTVASAIDTGTLQTADVSAVPVTCFTSPQLASVGLSQQQATDQGLTVRVGRVDASSIGAAVVADERDFFAKFVISAENDRILGAQVAGPTASDVIYAAAVAIKAGMTAEALQSVIGVHPSYAEAEFYAAW